MPIEYWGEVCNTLQFIGFMLGSISFITFSLMLLVSGYSFKNSKQRLLLFLFLMLGILGLSMYTFIPSAEVVKLL